MRVVSRFLGLSLALSMLLVPGLAVGSQSNDEPVVPDCDVELVAGLGPACIRPDGLYEVFDDQGRSLGTTHGMDPAPDADELATPFAAHDPACVPRTSDGYYARVIYAYASDRSPTKSIGTIRDLVRQANGILHEEGASLGHVRDLRVLCTSNGDIDVTTVKLPTRRSSTTFSSVSSDLDALGYDDPRLHYWVYFEDTINCGCGGTANIMNDASPGLGNNNNGEGPVYAVTFGYLSPSIMLHEISHNSGAVQNNSPHNSGGWHCNDGRDIMCYSDGGSRSDYDPGVCSVTHFDCGHDDYFNPTPPQISYLAFNWNLGAVEHRFYRGCAEAQDQMTVTHAGPSTRLLQTTAVHPLANDCSGREFVLEGWLPQTSVGGTSARPVANMEVCWFDTSASSITNLGCHSSVTGAAYGTVPNGANEAHIKARAGVGVDYFLRVS